MSFDIPRVCSADASMGVSTSGDPSAFPPLEGESPTFKSEEEVREGASCVSVLAHAMTVEGTTQ
jgi:hypothetical protein